MVTFLSKNLENVRSDTLPENTGYKDDGCDLSSSCLKCHLPLCKYDDSKFLLREIKIIRDKEIYNLSINGTSVDDLSKKFSLSKRTIQRAIKFSKERILKSGYYYSVVSKLAAIVVMINSVLENTPQDKKSKELKNTVLEGFQDLDPNDYKTLTKTLLAAMEKGDLDPESMARFVEKGICSGKFVKKDGSFGIMELTQKLVNLIISYKHTEEGTSLPIVGKIGLEKATDVDCFHYWSYINSFNLVNGVRRS